MQRCWVEPDREPGNERLYIRCAGLCYAVRFGVDNEIATPTDIVKNFKIVNSTLKSACAASDDAGIVFRHTATNATPKMRMNFLAQLFAD